MQYYSWSILRVSHTMRVVLCFLLFLSSLSCCSLPPALCSFSTLPKFDSFVFSRKIHLRSQSNLSHLREPNHGAAVASSPGLAPFDPPAHRLGNTLGTGPFPPPNQPIGTGRTSNRASCWYHSPEYPILNISSGRERFYFNTYRITRICGSISTFCVSKPTSSGFGGTITGDWTADLYAVEEPTTWRIGGLASSKQAARLGCPSISLQKQKTVNCLGRLPSVVAYALERPIVDP